jgi:choline monooxygenase
MSAPAPPQALDVAADIGCARTPDKALYLDPAMWAALRERAFVPSWQWLDELAADAAPQSLTPLTLLPGLLDEPLLLARDGAGTLRVLPNTCTHRGALLVEAPCRAAQIRCPYHSRRFELDGRMSFMPGFEGARDFPSVADHLQPLPLERWGPLAFTSLAPAAPFEAVFGAVMERTEGLPWHAFSRDPSRDRDYRFAAHWALYVENYLEGLHIPFVHPGLARSVGLEAYRYALYPQAVLQLAGARDGEPAFELPAGHPDHGQRIGAYYWWLFPNLMLNFYPWGLSLNIVEPLAPDRTRVRFRAWVRDPALLGAGAGAALDEVELEDEAIVQRVQRGLASRFFRRGRYSPAHERGVHHFHRLLSERMSAP